MDKQKNIAENKSSSFSSTSLSPQSSSDSEKNNVQQYYNRNVWHVTTTAAKTKIESRAKQLSKISNEIFTNPDASHDEKEAHKYLCDILKKVGCVVHSSYIHPTAFKAVFQSGSKSENEASSGPTVGLICEYDAVPGYVHSCGHNLSTEATIGALIGVRAAMKSDTRLVGKLVILGTPATEENGGKIKMMKEGVFDGIDVIISVHPSTYDCLFPRFYASQKVPKSFLIESLKQNS